MAKRTDGSESNGNSSPAELEASNKVILITVHGTGAGDVTATGDRWWQLKSHFLNELSKRLDLDPSRVEVLPFQWDLGPNSETERRVAGMALYEKLKSYEESGNDYYLIGHSHGGSVVYSSLLQSVAANGPLKRLKCWCTVGTPFLDYRSNKFLFQRLEGMSLALYTTGMVALLLGLWVRINLWQRDGLVDEILLGSMGNGLMIYGILCMAGLYLYELFHRSWFTRKRKKMTAELYSRSWLGLWHLEDEAISALANIKKVNAPIIPRDFLKPLIAIAQLSAVIGFGVFLAFDLSMSNETYLGRIAADLAEDTGNTTGDMAFMSSWMILVLGIPVLYIFGKFFNFVAYALGPLLSKMLNSLVWSSVRRSAWGDDVLKEDVREIGSHPPEFAEKFGPLPDQVADPLRGHSEKHAIMTLHKVREVLGMTQDSQTTADLRAELSENLQWQELIHTSYFDVPEFIDLVALGLHRAGLGGLREGFTLTAERDKLADWCGGAPVN